MVCRHVHGDPECSSSPEGARRVAEQNAEYQRREQEKRDKEAKRTADARAAEIYAATPDAERYVIDDVQRIGHNLVLRVTYPNCKKCSYEGTKVLVYLNVTEAQALRWRKIDPHFVDPKTTRPATEAPGPSARFPASGDGWNDALAYATTKKGT